VNGAVAEVATVVGKEYDEGVIGDLFVVEELQDAPDVGVKVVDDGSIGLHAQGFVLAGGFGKFFPTANIGHWRGVAVTIINEAELAEFSDALFSEDAPSLIELAVVFFDKVLRDIERSVGRVEGKVGEERFPGFEEFFHAGDGMGGEGVGGKPIVGDCFGFALAHDATGAGEVIDGSAQEAVEFLKAMIHGVGGLVPFPGDGSLITGVSEGFGKRERSGIVGGLGVLVTSE